MGESVVERLSRAEVEALGDQIAELSLRIDVAKHSMLTHLRTFDENNGWSDSGFISLAAWLSWRVGIGPVAAREHVRVARALGELKLVDAAFASGKLSWSKVRAITRAATPETEQDFIDIAMHATASQIERLTAAYRRVRVDSKVPPADQRRFVRRSETASGMVRIDVQLPPEQANVVWEALTTALDRRPNDSAESASDAEPDASAETKPVERDPSRLPSDRADALVSVAQAYLEHRPRTLGSGYEMVVMTTKEQLEHGHAGVGGYLRDGTPVPLHMARMLACDCSRVDVDVGHSGEILDVGRARRTIPSAIGRALWLRDGGCRAPGCGRKRHLHAHHIEAWADGGKTAMSNLVLLCPSHHMLVHEGQLFVKLRDGKVVFENRHGLKLEPVPARCDDFEQIEQWMATPEVGLEGNNFPLWDGSKMHLAEAIDWLYLTHGVATEPHKG